MIFARLAGLSGVKKLLRELASGNKAAARKAFGKGEGYYYVFQLGADEEARGKALCSKIVRRYQEVEGR